MSSDSEDLEVDFPNYCLNQPHEEPTAIPQDPNPPAKSPVKEQQEQEHVIDACIEGPSHPANFPAGDVEEPQDPGNFNPVPAQPPVLMTNNQLN